MNNVASEAQRQVFLRSHLYAGVKHELMISESTDPNPISHAV